MVLRKPDMQKCDEKCQCGPNTNNPGVIYSCDNPCGGIAPFDAEKCDCGLGEGFRSIGAAWQMKLNVEGRISWSNPGWYNGSQNWNTHTAASSSKLNRVFFQYASFNSFGCVTDGNWSDYPSKGVFSIYWILAPGATDPPEKQYRGMGNCYWPEYCDSCWYTSGINRKYRYRETFGSVVGRRNRSYFDENGEPQSTIDTIQLYYGMPEEGRDQPGYRELLEFTDPELDEADPSRPRVIDGRGQYNISRNMGEGCDCKVHDEIKGPLGYTRGDVTGIT